MGFFRKVICRECGTQPASYRCVKCGYTICKSCAKNLGGGALSTPKCPMCGSKQWKGA